MCANSLTNVNASGPWSEWGWAPPLCVTFDLSHAPSISLAASPVQSVNEEEDQDGMVGTAWLKERDVECVEVDLLHPHRKWVV